ncbi:MULTISPECIES: prenyltransferase/squalene oxidase repeat-containing protein [Pseudomonas]|uniref:prenyltransferase/squalene oxidase repeat-containing protein n=1 Tax=Pseudomonas TaxID=286 RepID=UPI001572020E|nr:MULTISPECIES: prenyltransferase/squalene oxidase repeat-containing protein [Pseudomonas]MBG6127976.1 prenyltransferase beta subunit [Pseudomonas sp. M2]NSX19033.1 prenyltransferase [Pseudomonas putida]HDS1743855.1 prenyltransferase [Pseudomonas putida]
MTPPRFPLGQGLGNGQPDLWCTYAAIRSLAWVGRLEQVDAPVLQAYILSRRNRDGGFAWSKGMPSDAWATFYCTETLHDLGVGVEQCDETAAWIATLFDGDAYAMCPGQTADVWASHYALRTLIEVCHGQVRDTEPLYAWLEGLQCANGGLSWSADFARRNLADTRACFYGVMAARALARQGLPAPQWNLPRLIGWLQAQQMDCGGFRFSEAAAVPCLWATYRATASLAALQAQPLSRQRCAEWIDALRGPTGAFVRWAGYDGEDVWAAFCALGSLKALGEPVAHLADGVAAFIATLSMPQGGYSYRRADTAADVLTTAAAVLGDSLAQQPRDAALRWIEGCQMPNEPGIMYMPGRGAEVRCTNWGLAAGAFAGQPGPRQAIGRWLASLQNPDGGFGFWEGRGSDMVSTASAVSILRQLGDDSGVDLAAIERYVVSCRQAHGYASFPRGEVSLRAGLQALACLAHIGNDVTEAAARLLAAHKVRQGGFANQGQRIPDLLSTYQAVALAADLGLPVDLAHLRFFLDKVRGAAGHAWSPLFLQGVDALSTCLGRLLDAFAQGQRQQLPSLQLS